MPTGPSTVRRLSDNTRALLLNLAYAAVAAGASVAFLTLTNLAFRVGIQRLADLSFPAFALSSLLVILVTSLLSGILMARVAPAAAGSGVPQMKAAYWKDLGFVQLRSVLVKFVAGILTLGGGTSLGREGPSVFVGGGVASSLAAVLRVPRSRRRQPVATGASSALAAAFNTPLASITFVLEELLNNQFGSGVLGGVVLAAVVGALVVHSLLGRQPAFSLPAVSMATWRMYLLAPFVAAAAALVGRVFQGLTLGLRRRVKRSSPIPPWLRPVVGALGTWILGIGAFALTGHIGVFGLGYGDLSLALNDRLLWQAAGILVAAKLLATVLSYGWGGCGGIFSPTLFLGGLTGLFLAGLAGTWIDLSAGDRVVLAAVGMASCFGAVVRAPLTALLIVFEMTHEFAMVPALMIAAVVSQAVARLGGGHNFYEELLLQDGHHLIEVKPPRDLESWQRLPISAIHRGEPVILESLAPEDLRAALEAYPYGRFPVRVGGRIAGVLTRREAQSAAATGGVPRLVEPAMASPETTVREVADLLVSSGAGMVLIAPEADPTRSIAGIVTLHDLLRVQVSLTE